MMSRSSRYACNQTPCSLNHVINHCTTLVNTKEVSDRPNGSTLY